MDWTSSNCDRCEKGSHRLEPHAWTDCELEGALVGACLGDGYIEKEIAQRLGVPGDNSCGWKCQEVAWIREWVIEKTKRDERERCAVLMEELGATYERVEGPGHVHYGGVEMSVQCAADAVRKLKD